MKLDQAIREACAIPDIDCFRRAREVREVVDFMRFRLGWNSEQAARAAERSGVDCQRWDELMLEADNLML